MAESAVAARPASARLGGLLALADGSAAYRELLERVERGGQVALGDSSPGARAFAWSALVANAGRTVVVVAPSEDRARRWRGELAGWLGEDRVLAFPERETMPYEIGRASATAVHQRLLTLWRLRERPSAVVVSLRALLQFTIPPRILAERSRVLKR